MISNLLNGILSLPLWLQMVLYVVLIVGGMFALIKGADAFVDGASGIAKRLKIPAIISFTKWVIDLAFRMVYTIPN